MRKMYRSIISFLEKLIVSFEINKMRISENIALIKKRKLLKEINWSKSTINAFDEYWKKHYGKTIKQCGHKLYEAINGVHHKDYMPDFLFATKVEPFFNPYFYAKLYSDKSLTEVLYAKSKKVSFPKTYLVNSGGILYDGERNIISPSEAQEVLSEINEAVIKPTVGGNSGKGVMVCNFVDGYDAKNDFNINQLLDEKRQNYIVQEKMQQHPVISKIYPNAVNTFRTITYVLDGVVYCAELAMRIGSGGGVVDNIHAGGLGIGVRENGKLLKYAYLLGYSNSKEKITEHPDSGVVFEDYQIVGVEKIIECAKELHGLTPHLEMISWDFMIDANENPVLIEANYWGQAVWLTQIIHGKPFFGINMDRVLKLIKEK